MSDNGIMIVERIRTRICTGKCRTIWRDPDYEYDKMRDEGSG